MNILYEIGLKLSRRVMQWLETPCDHPRPQDDIPDEVILRHLHSDYRKYLHERMTLIAYIRKLEVLYKNTQSELFRISVSSSPPTKKRIIQQLRILTYNLTKEHIAAQQSLRSMLGESNNNENNVNNESN